MDGWIGYGLDRRGVDGLGLVGCSNIVSCMSCPGRPGLFLALLLRFFLVTFSFLFWRGAREALDVCGHA